MTSRRRWLTGLFGFAASAITLRSATAAAPVNNTAPPANNKAPSALPAASSPRFPGDPTDHNVIYQFNKSSQDYQHAVLFSVGEMLRRYEDNISIVVSAFGPGIHILAKKPMRAVDAETRERVNSLAQYGVKFNACGNTMISLGWTEQDMLPFVKVVKVGAADIIEHQEKGFSYISW